MILSVSRRTDIPNYYSDWFYNRLQAGWLCVRNPMNAKQVSRLTLTPETIDAIVFWTKNPEPMLGRLRELADYPYYVQFTLTGYGTDLEPGIPPKREHMLSVFRRFAEAVGAEQVVWRYDPILFTPNYTPGYHIKAFSQIARTLEGCTDRVVISFLDYYAKTKRNLKGWKLIPEGEISQSALLPEAQRMVFSSFVQELADVAKTHGMEIFTCAEQMDLSAYGIRHGSCIDQTWIERLLGYRVQAKKDRNQREICGCIESIDVGTYHTCRNGCRYCYANENEERVKALAGQYDPQSPVLCGRLGEEDTVRDRVCHKLPRA